MLLTNIDQCTYGHYTMQGKIRGLLPNNDRYMYESIAVHWMNKMLYAVISCLYLQSQCERPKRFSSKAAYPVCRRSKFGNPSLGFEPSKTGSCWYPAWCYRNRFSRSAWIRWRSVSRKIWESEEWHSQRCVHYQAIPTERKRKWLWCDVHVYIISKHSISITCCSTFDIGLCSCCPEPARRTRINT